MAARATRGAGTGLATAVVICLLLALAPAGASAFGLLSSFGSEGTGAGQLTNPQAVAIGADGSIFVADEENRRVDVFAPSGAFLRAFGGAVNPVDKSGTCTAVSGCLAGSGNDRAGTVAGPSGIALGPGGLLYVADGETTRIDVFAADGRFVFAFGKEVNPDDDSDVCTMLSGCKFGEDSAVSGAIGGTAQIAFGPEGKLFVADATNNRIDVFGAGGEFVRAFGLEVNVGGGDVCVEECRKGAETDKGGAIHRPLGVAVDSSGQVFVADSLNNRVDVFTRDGVFIRAFGHEVSVSGGDVCTGLLGCKAGAPSGAATALNGPTGVALGSDGRVAVANTLASSVVEFRADGALLTAFGDATATPDPRGLAFDCAGALFVAEAPKGASLVARFGEPGAELPPCPPRAMPPPHPVPRKFKFLGLKRDPRHGTAKLSLLAPAAGRILLKGKGIRTVRRAVKKAGRISLPVALTGSAKQKLLKTGRAKVTARISLSALAGGAVTQAARSLVLKRTIRRR